MELHELYGDKIDLLLPHRNFIEEIDDLYMVDVHSKEPKKWRLYLFSDCLIIVTELKKQNKIAYFGSTEFHENSFIYAKADLKYYQNLIKIVGKDACFIIGGKNAAKREYVVQQCGKYIFQVRRNIQKRKSVLKTKQIETHIDIEIVCTEWQGEKLVYILEVTKSILSNAENKRNRKNGALMFKLFKRYSNVEEYHKKICSEFNSKDFPPIPGKSKFMNSKTELIQRRQVNFELFFQKVCLVRQFLEHPITQEFFKFNYNYDKEDKNEVLTINFCHKKHLKLKVSYETTTFDILNEISTIWDIRDIDRYRICFVHCKHGEKLLDWYECPLHLVENYDVSGFSLKLFGKKVTKKMSKEILEFFDGKSHVFYVKRVIFHPEDFSFDFRMKDDELKLRYYQAVFDLKVSNIVLTLPEYVEFCGLRALILWGSLEKRDSYDIIPFKEIRSIIPNDIYKKQKNAKWEESFLEKYSEFSSQGYTQEQAMKHFLELIATRYWYGATLFWVENYYK